MVNANDWIAITDLCNRQSLAIDDRDAAAFVAAFTEDGVFEMPEGEYVGPERLATLIDESKDLPRRQHWVGGLLIDGEGDVATARANGVVIEDKDGVQQISGFAIQKYEFRRVDGTWLITRETVIRPRKAS